MANAFFQQPLKPTSYRSTPARLNRLLKKSEQQIPRGLKPPQQAQNRRLSGPR